MCYADKTLRLFSPLSFDNMIEWAISGVNTSSTSGGPICRNFMTDTRRLAETFLAVGLAVLLVAWGYANLTLPKTNNYVYKHQTGKILLLVLFSVAFGIEIGFKFASKTVIYLLNPCHVMTVIQVSLQLWMTFGTGNNSFSFPAIFAVCHSKQ